jgi:hypothetical protein
MAKLVRVCRNNEEDEALNNYQKPLVIDGDLKVCLISNIYLDFWPFLPAIFYMLDKTGMHGLKHTNVR